MTTSASGDWESLDPWEKAFQWHQVAPEISDEIMRLAKAKAIQDRREQIQESKRRQEADKFAREQQAERDRRQFDLAHQQALREYELTKAYIESENALAKRLWWTQLIGVVGGLLLLAVLIGTAWHFSGEGNVGSSAAIFGVGSALTAGIFGVNVSAKRTIQAARDRISRELPGGTDRG